MATAPQVVQWKDPVTGLVTSGITNYQSGSTGGLNPTTMSMYLGGGGGNGSAPASQGSVPNMPQGSPYQTGVTTTAPDPANQGGTVTYPNNPQQWATDPSAAALAQYLHGSVVQQQLTAPGGTYSTPQNQISVPGSPSTLNAGLAINTLGNYGAGPTSQGMYQVQRDLGNVPPGQTYAQWALSNPNFQMDPTQSNSGPGYNMVYNPATGKYVNNASGTANLAGPGMSQADAIAQMRKLNGVGTPGAPGSTPAGNVVSGNTSQTKQPGGNVNKPSGWTSPSWVPPGYQINPTTGTLQRSTTPPGVQPVTTTGTSPNTTMLGNGTFTQVSPDRGDNPAMGAGNIDATGLSVQADINGAYTGQVSIGGQPTTVAITPDGRVFDSNGQDISSQFSSSDLTSLRTAFGQASNDPNYLGSLSQVDSGVTAGPGGGPGTGPSTGGTGPSVGGTGPSVGGTGPSTGYQPPPPGGDNQPPPPPGGNNQPPPPGGNQGGVISSGNTGLLSGPAGPGTGTYPNINNPYSGFGLGGGNPYNYLGQGYTDANGNYIPPQLAPNTPGLGVSVQPGQSPYTGSALDQQATSNRNITLGQGSSIDQALQNYVNFSSGQNMVDQAQLNSAYAPIAAGQGGYSMAEQNAILQQPYLNSLQITPDQEQSNYLTQDEQAAIQANPNQVMTQLGSDEGGIDAATNSNAAQIYGRLNDQSQGVNDALAGSATGVRGAAGQEYSNISNVLSATNPAVNNAVTQTAANVNPYIDPTALNASANYMQNETVSPQDQENIINSAGSTVGNQELSDEERLMMQANAQGNTSPLALAASRERMRQAAASNEAQAMTDAAIKAKQLQLNTTQAQENTRLGAAQNYAGLGTGTQMALGNQNVAAQQYLGNLGLQGSAVEGAAQLGAEQYLGNQAQQAQQYLGSSALSNQQQLGNQQTAAAEYKTGQNVNAGEYVDQATSQRAAQLAANRQATNQYNQSQEFGRGQYIYGQSSAANTNFANQRLQQEQEYRQYLQNQQNQANQNVSVGNQQRIGNYGTQTGGINQATGVGVTNYGTKPGDPTTATNLATSITGDIHNIMNAKGGVSQGPHLALVGEAGPELIVDLSGIKKDEYGEDPTGEGGSFEGGYDPYLSAIDSELSDPYTRSGGSGSGEVEQESHTMPQGNTVTKGEDVSKNSNPIYLSILRAMMGQNPTSNQWQIPTPPNYTSSSGGSGGGGIIGAIGSLLGLAEGGVTEPPSRQHYYGSPAKLHKGLDALAMSPKVEMVTHPQIRMLGAKRPEAVIPLTQRKGNKTSLAGLPSLMRKFGNYPATV